MARQTTNIAWSDEPDGGWNIDQPRFYTLLPYYYRWVGAATVTDGPMAIKPFVAGYASVASTK